MAENFLLLQNNGFIELEDDSGAILLEQGGNFPIFSFGANLINVCMDVCTGVIDGQTPP